MSLYAYDENGFIGDAASLNGWDAFFGWVTQFKKTECNQLVIEGFSDNPKTLSSELAMLKAVDPDIESVRKNIEQLAGKAVGVLIISEGFE